MRTAVIELPPDTGKIVAADCDFEGAGTFPVAGKFKADKSKSSRVILKTTYTYSKPGTYFPTHLAVSQQQGDAKMPYARIRNLGRVRVVGR